jgi:subtilisin family serine protease
VIDTGIDTDHPEFAGRISEYSYNATEDKIVKDYNDWSLIEDQQGHGTAVAGVIGAPANGVGIVGMAPDVQILVIKAECDANGSFKRTSDLVFGLYYAIERDVQIVNMSFGTYSLENPFAEATQLAVDSDIICVAAAGNDSTSMLSWPAADENVIGVGALGDGWELAYYSNYGENTDLVAPGTTYTTQMGGGYDESTGTSLASPVVAGAIALLMQNNPYMWFEEVTEVLYASCYDLGDLGRDWDYGFGALDVNALVLEQRGTIHFDMLTDE